MWSTKSYCTIFNFCDEINIVNGIVLKGNKIISPETMHKDILWQLHIGQLGI